MKNKLSRLFCSFLFCRRGRHSSKRWRQWIQSRFPAADEISSTFSVRASFGLRSKFWDIDTASTIAAGCSSDIQDGDLCGYNLPYSESCQRDISFAFYASPVSVPTACTWVSIKCINRFTYSLLLLSTLLLGDSAASLYVPGTITGMSLKVSDKKVPFSQHKHVVTGHITSIWRWVLSPCPLLSLSPRFLSTLVSPSRTHNLSELSHDFLFSLIW